MVTLCKCLFWPLLQILLTTALRYLSYLFRFFLNMRHSFYCIWYRLFPFVFVVVCLTLIQLASISWFSLGVHIPLGLWIASPYHLYQERQKFSPWFPSHKSEGKGPCLRTLGLRDYLFLSVLSTCHFYQQHWPLLALL